MSSRWTIATAVVAGLVLSLFVAQIAGVIGYGFAVLFNATSTLHYAAMRALHGVDSNVTVPGNKTVVVGNYTAVVSEADQPLLASMENAVFAVVDILLKILTTPPLLAVVIAVSIIIVVYEVS